MSQEPERRSTVVRPEVSYDWYLILRWWHVNFIIVCPSIIQDYQKTHLKKNGEMHSLIVLLQLTRMFLLSFEIVLVVHCLVMIFCKQFVQLTTTTYSR